MGVFNRYAQAGQRPSLPVGARDAGPGGRRRTRPKAAGRAEPLSVLDPPGRLILLVQPRAPEAAVETIQMELNGVAARAGCKRFGKAGQGGAQTTLHLQRRSTVLTDLM